VLLRGFLRDWRAARTWTPAGFAARFGNESISVARSGSVDAPGGGKTGPYGGAVTVTMGEFAALCEAPPPMSDLYLVAQSQLLRRPPFSGLRADLAFDPQWFDATDWALCVGLWMGPAGAVTPLHFDLQDALLAQAHGRKRVILISPADSAHLYPRGGYSAVDPEQPDRAAHPLFTGATLFEAVLEHTDALYLPYGWWHHVRSLTASISLSMSHFAWRA
jgi:hypothetical protein